MEDTMTDHSIPDEIRPARDQIAHETKRVLGEEMMSRRFIDAAPHCRELQRGVLLVFIGVLLLLLLQQVMTSDPAMQIAHQQRGAVSATGAIGTHVPPVWERNDP
jgi:hypothetical protein